MKEELDSQLSAMFDDELPEAECQLLARRLSRDDALKARWRHYAVIGASVRAERGVRLETNLATRVSAVISAEPALAGAAVAHSHARGGSFRWWHPIAGGAIAAGVAALSVLWIRGQAPVGVATPLAQTSVPAAIVAQAPPPADAINNDSRTPESYVVPPNVELRSMAPTAELANYVVAHSEYSTPVSRRNLLSALVASESGTQGVADESENATDDADVIEDPTGYAEETK
jgi:negative regulator of sigma E activity